MRGLTARAAVDLVAVDAAVDERYWAKLAELVRPEFRVDLYRPALSDVVLRIYIGCEVPGCRGKALKNQRLCRRHDARWADDGSPPIDEWLATFPPTEPDGESRRCRVAGCPNIAWGELCRTHRNESLVAEREGVSLAEFLATATPAPAEPPCLVLTCGRGRFSANHPFCEGHYKQWAAAGKPPPESFITQARHIRTSVDFVYCFAGLPPGPKLELQYCLQKRRDDAKVQMAPKRLTLVATAIITAAPHCRSILDHPLDFWESALRDVWDSTPSAQLRQMTLSWLRWCYDTLQLLVDVDPHAPDVWDLRRIDSAAAARTGIRLIRWDRISQPWLRDAAKRWGRMRLVRVSAGTVSTDAYNLGRVSAYLDSVGVSGPTGITRHVLEGFIAALAELAPSYETRSRILGTLRVFLDDARHQDLLALHPTAVVLEGDWPRRDEKLPRPIPERRHGGPRCPREPRPSARQRVRALVVVLMGTGRRAGEAIRLPFDPVVIGPDGDPYLRYNDWKTHKEAVIPLDAATTAVIRAQQAAVRDQFPDGCRWLFPGFRHNRAGKHHISHESLNAALHRWAANWTLYDLPDPETGERPPLRLTAHRFRHTIATRMLNEDVPNWVVQRFLGHESPEMTARYANPRESRLMGEDLLVAC